MLDMTVQKMSLRAKSRPYEVFALSALLIVGSASVAAAQVGPGNAAKPNTTIPEKVAPPMKTPPGVLGNPKTNMKTVPKNGVLTPPKNGVIKPKRNVDPEMTKTPPANNPDSMPVIPPSATPNGSSAK
jgi:hypothetical protein